MNPVLQKLAALAVTLLTGLCASAFDFNTGGIYYNITDPTAKEVEVTYGDDEDEVYTGEIVVPSSVSYNDEQYTVTTIGDNAFSSSYLSSITLPNSVTTIGESAFDGCEGLTSITLPNSVTTIGDMAFYNCRNLASVTMPNNLTTIGSYAFANCRSMTSITLPNSVTTIGEGTFSSCNALTSITLPDNLTTIEGDTFSGCNSLTSITLPNSVTAIGNQAFAGCSSLTSITLPNSVTTISYRTFYECSSLTSVTLPVLLEAIENQAFAKCNSLTSITLPNSVYTIGEKVFDGCNALMNIDIDADNQVYSSVDGILYDKEQTSLICCPAGKTGDVVVPNTVTTIENRAFFDCSKLTSITLPNSVITIRDYAFSGCSGLTSITLPDNLMRIGDFAFENCSSLTSLTSLAVTPPECSKNTFNGIDKQNCTLYVPTESVEVYKQAAKWKEFTFIEEIGSVRNFEVDGIYYNVTDKTANEVEVISGENKYSGEIIVPSTVTYNSKQYTVTAVANQAFFQCFSLTSVTLPNSVTAIGEQAFANCSDLASVTLPDNLTTIEDRAFEFCRSLTLISMPNSVTTIGNQAFANCNGLTSVTLSNSLTTIGDWTFSGCTSLASITLPGSVTTIGSNVFAGCDALTSIDVDADNQAYSSLDGILYDKAQTSLICCPEGKTGDVTIPNTVASVGDEAFSDCSGLVSITSQAVTPPECHESTFNGVDKDNCILYVPEESIDDYKQATGWKDFLLIEEIGGANSFVVDGICYNVTDKTAKEVEVIARENKYSGNIVVPSTVTYNKKTYTVTAIADYTFRNCFDLASVSMPNTVTTIGVEAFRNCTGLTYITIPNSVTAIGNGAFFGCSGMTNINVDADNRKYSSVDGILYDKAQTNLICCPAGNPGEVIIPNTVTTICDYAFAACKGLTSITLPDAVTTIGEYTFSQCDGLTSITLPGSVNTIGNYALSWCDKLTSITSLAVVPPVCADYTFEGADTQNCTLYVPAESIDAYKQAMGWKDFLLIEDVGVLSSIDSVGEDSTANVEVFNLNGVKVPDTLENLPAGMYIVRNGSTVRKVVIR